MKLYLDKSEFGALFETAITEAINKTSLADYALHNVFLSLDTTWHQFDHLILLPHKIVVIEAKTTQAVQYDIHSAHDTLTYANGGVRNYKGLVRQTNRMRRTLTALYGKEYGLGNINIEIVGCVDANKVTSYQSNVTVYKREDIWYYLNLLERELSLYPNMVKLRAHQDLLSVLIPHFKSEVDFKYQIEVASSLHNVSMLVDSKYADRVSLDYTLTDEPVMAIKTELQLRESDYTSTLHTILGYVPTNASAVYNATRSENTKQVIDYILALETVLQSYPYLKGLLYNSDTYIGEVFITSACEELGLTLTTFLYEVVNYLKRVESDMFMMLKSGVATVGYKAVDYTDVYNVLVKAISR